MYADIFAGTNLREATIGSIPTWAETGDKQRELSFFDCDTNTVYISTKQMGVRYTWELKHIEHL